MYIVAACTSGPGEIPYAEGLPSSLTFIQTSARCSQCCTVLPLTYSAFPFVFMLPPCKAITLSHISQKHEGWLWQLEAPCLASCAHDVLHPWQAFDAPHVSQSASITSFDSILFWRNNREVLTQGSASPSDYTKAICLCTATGLIHRGLGWESCVVGGTGEALWMKPWSSQTRIDRLLLWRLCSVCTMQPDW